MLRRFRAADIPAYMDLYRQHFPDEARVLLTDAAAFQKVLERGFSPIGRLFLGTLRAFRRPMLDFLALEEDGRLAGATFLFHQGALGHISSVVVDAPYRRRGLAKSLMAEAERIARRWRRRFAVLDVISTNAGARRLYEGLGYRPIRRVGWFVLDLPDGARSLPIPDEAAVGRGVRKLRRRDGAPLARLARAQQPPEDLAVRPVEPGSFRVAPLLAQAFGSRTKAFVLDRTGAPVGFARSTSSGAMASGHLVPPILDPTVEEPEADALYASAFAFFRERPVRRIVAEAALDDARSVGRLTERGFRNELTMETLAKPLNA